MRKSFLHLGVLQALAAAGIFETPAATSAAVRVTRGPRGKALRRIQPRHTGRAYPEQSTRQALRRFRRAQGGPGLTFTGTGYGPRA